MDKLNDGYIESDLMTISHPELGRIDMGEKSFIRLDQSKKFSENRFKSGKSVDEYVKDGKKLSPVAVNMIDSEVALIELDDGSIVNREMAVTLCQKGLIPGYIVGTSKTGELFMKSSNDSELGNNLGYLPEIK